MGTTIRCGLTALLFTLVVTPELGFCDCILGGNYTDFYKLKNSTIWKNFNNTLMSYTEEYDQKIANFSEFRLWSYIKRSLSVTPDSYLFEGVCLGRLLALDWKKATQLYTTSSTDNRTLEVYIREEFIDSLHYTLQELASNYSFSLGIFRPRELQFNYVGVYPSKLRYSDGQVFDRNCMAGIRFLWHLSTSLKYDQRFEDKLGPYFARFSNMIENSFDQYYRKHKTLGMDFVRVNVLEACNTSNYVIAFMEAYFINDSLTVEDLARLTDMHQVPAMYFSNGTSRPVSVTLNDARYTYIVNATIAPHTTISTTSVETTLDEDETQSLNESTTESTDISLQNATENTTETTTTGTEIYPENVRGSTGISTETTQAEREFSPTTNATTVSNTAKIQSTTTVAKNSEPEKPNSPVFIEVNKLVTATSSTIAPVTSKTSFLNTTRQAVSQNTTTTAMLTSPITESATSSTVQSTSTTLSTTQPLINTSSSTILVKNATDSSGFINASSLPPSSTTAFQITSRATVSNQSAVATSATSMRNNSENSTGSSTTYNPTIFRANATISVGLYTTYNVKTTEFGNQNTTGSTIGNRSSTTFDPDPLFLASAPVLKKVYNDGLLLGKITPMLPITGKMAFFTITIPVALSVILFAIVCMVCWQVDCFPARRKT